MNKIKEDVAKSPDELYKEYITKHRQGVLETFYNVLLPVLQEDESVSEEVLHVLPYVINHHDASKFGEEEWAAYRNYFYDKEHYSRSSEEFNLAWNHHQKSNPHHWQYWCLINDVDNPQVQPLDMPLECIIEMLCDWQSAGLHYGNTAYDWYEKQKNRMILSDNTRKFVEKYIVYLK